MKLPREIIRNRASTFDEMERTEAVVRDCAKVCRDNAERAEKAGARAIAQAHSVDAVDIERRYGLDAA